MTRALVAMLVLGTGITLISEKTNAQNDCLTTALSDYTRATTALSQSSFPLMSIEATIAQRRLQERYCLRVAQCDVVGITNPAMPMAAAFSSCLRDEAVENNK